MFEVGEGVVEVVGTHYQVLCKEDGFLTQTLKLSHQGSVMGAPSGTAVGGDVVRWPGGGCEVVVAVGSFIQLCKQGQWV